MVVVFVGAAFVVVVIAVVGVVGGAVFVGIILGDIKLKSLTYRRCLHLQMLGRLGVVSFAPRCSRLPW